jgi:hypothetical protein
MDNAGARQQPPRSLPGTGCPLRTGRLFRGPRGRLPAPLRLIVILLLALGAVPGIPGLDQLRDGLWPGSLTTRAESHALALGGGERARGSAAAQALGQVSTSAELPVFARLPTTDLWATLVSWTPARGISRPGSKQHALAHAILVAVAPDSPELRVRAYGTALVAAGLLLSMVGLRWSRPLRGPPVLASHA